jgi:hypothetical protein
MARGVDQILDTGAHNAVLVAASGTAKSGPIDLANGISAQGFFSLQVVATGNAGVLTFSYELSNDGTNYVTPASATNIATGVSTTSGPGNAGVHMFSFSPMIARYIKIVALETGGAANVTITTRLVYQ